MTTNSKSKSAIVELKALLEDDEDRLRTLFQEVLQELLEQEMTRALAETKSLRPSDGTDCTGNRPYFTRFTVAILPGEIEHCPRSGFGSTSRSTISASMSAPPI